MDSNLRGNDKPIAAIIRFAPIMGSLGLVPGGAAPLQLSQDFGSGHLVIFSPVFPQNDDDIKRAGGVVTVANIAGDGPQ